MGRSSVGSTGFLDELLETWRSSLLIQPTDIIAITILLITCHILIYNFVNYMYNIKNLSLVNLRHYCTHQSLDYGFKNYIDMC